MRFLLPLRRRFHRVYEKWVKRYADQERNHGTYDRSWITSKYCPDAIRHRSQSDDLVPSKSASPANLIVDDLHNCNRSVNIRNNNQNDGQINDPFELSRDRWRHCGEQSDGHQYAHDREADSGYSVAVHASEDSREHTIIGGCFGGLSNQHHPPAERS